MVGSYRQTIVCVCVCVACVCVAGDSGGGHTIIHLRARPKSPKFTPGENTYETTDLSWVIFLRA